jgi:PP-loop superfamily ATP-utilizing enzyme
MENEIRKTIGVNLTHKQKHICKPRKVTRQTETPAANIGRVWRQADIILRLTVFSKFENCFFG